MADGSSSLFHKNDVIIDISAIVKDYLCINQILDFIGQLTI